MKGDKVDAAIAAVQPEPAGPEERMVVTVPLSPTRIAQLNLPKPPITQMEMCRLIETVMQVTIKSQESKVLGPDGNPLLIQ